MMSDKKKIGITSRMMKTEGHGEVRDAISHDWICFIEEAGASPVMIPNNLKDPVEYFMNEGCDVLLLGNGEDVRLNIGPNGGFCGSKRDITEARLLENAIEKDIQTIGVCRGMQLVNVYFGGILSEVNGHVTKKHGITVVDEDIRDVFNQKQLDVNSYHNMGILKNDVGEGLVVCAVRDDVVEAMYHEKHRIFAIQWHPERESENKDFDVELFQKALEGKIFHNLKV